MIAKPTMGDAGNAARDNVRRIRNLRGLTYKELSDRLENLGRPIPVLGLSRLEKGERRVDVDDLVALAAVLGVGVMELLGESACEACHGNPPAGFTCDTCGRSGS